MLDLYSPQPPEAGEATPEYAQTTMAGLTLAMVLTGEQVQAGSDGEKGTKSQPQMTEGSAAPLRRTQDLDRSPTLKQSRCRHQSQEPGLLHATHNQRRLRGR